METRGRKTIDKEALTETISLRFSKEEMQEIEKMAKDLNMPKTRLLRNLALTSLDDAKVLHNMGILKGAKKFKEFKEKFSSIVNRDNS